MRIVHVVFSFCTGGLETMLVDIMREQVASDDVHLIVVNSLYDRTLLATIDERVNVHLLNRQPGSRAPWPIVRLNWLLGRLRADAVHIHQGSLARWIRVGRRPVLTVHDLNIPLDDRALRCQKIAISEAVADDLRSRYGERGEAVVVPNGIDTSAIQVRGERPLSTPIRLVQVARFDIHKKGQDILIQALRRMVDDGYDVDLTLIGGADFDNIPQLEALAHECGVAERVHIVKGMSRKELYDSLKEFDIMVHPSRYEGFGLVIAEGMAAGLPIVVPKGGGPYEVADSGRLAEVFESGNAEGCARAVEKVIDNYPAALEKASEGRSRVEDLYSLRRLVRSYRRIYQGFA